MKHFFTLSFMSLLLCCVQSVSASEASVYVDRVYDEIPPAPKSQSMAEALQKSAGCQSCHTTTDSMTMHESPSVVLGCTDCHGGDASARAAQLPGRLALSAQR